MLVVELFQLNEDPLNKIKAVTRDHIDDIQIDFPTLL